MATAAPLALRSFEYWLFQYKRTWRGSVISTILFPVLFLASMGLGLGTLVDSSTSGGVEGHSYLVFLAPGLLAATAMQTAVGESTYPVMGAIKWVKTYHAMLATPLGVLDVLVGHLLYIGVRVLIGSTIFLAVMTAFGAVDSPLALLTLPAALLTGLAFATPVVAYSAVLENDYGFAVLLRFVVDAAVPVRRRVLPGDAAAAGAGAAGIPHPALARRRAVPRARARHRDGGQRPAARGLPGRLDRGRVRVRRPQLPAPAGGLRWLATP